MDNLSDRERSEAREQFENQLRFAFVKYEGVEEDDEVVEVRKYCVYSLLNRKQARWQHCSSRHSYFTARTGTSVYCL